MPYFGWGIQPFAPGLFATGLLHPVFCTRSFAQRSPFVDETEKTPLEAILTGKIAPLGERNVPSGIDKQPARREVEDMERRLAGG